MLDWRYIVKNPEEFVKRMQGRGYSQDEASSACQKVLDLSEERLSSQKKADELKNERNILSKSVGTLMREGKKDEAEKIKIQSKGIGDQIEHLEALLENAEDGFRSVLELFPNLPHETVPIGRSEKDNKEIRSWGEKRNFSFVPKAHDEVGGGRYLDFERAAKTSGARFVFLKGAAAKLERALVNFMFDTHSQKGYQEVIPPYLVNEATMYGIGQFPKFKEDVYKIEGQDRYLIPTSEVPMTSLHSQEILAEADLPIKYVAFSPCFRSEAGSYGKDTKGLIRQHQFHKVELIKFCSPEDSLKELESMVSDAEDILKLLKLPYRVLLLCSGDMGANAQKTYDLEVWLPGSKHDSETLGCYREISSCSDCCDFQARRSGIRYKGKSFKGTQFVHTLNGSGLAVGRTLVAILENYQNEDGSIRVPDVLKPYLGNQDILN